MSKQQGKNSIVPTWLRAIHLSEQIIETFEAAGIVNPIDLVDLQPAHYPALGITEPGDRKKLFYLVQRVKIAFQEEEQAAAADDRSLKTVALSTAALSAEDDSSSTSSSSSSDGEVPLPPPLAAPSKFNARQLHVSTDFSEPVASTVSNKKDEDAVPAVANTRSFVDNSTSLSQRRPSNPQTVAAAISNKIPKPIATATTNMVSNPVASSAPRGLVSLKPAAAGAGVSSTQQMARLEATKLVKGSPSPTSTAPLGTAVPATRSSNSPNNFDSRQFASESSKHTLANAVGSSSSSSSNIGYPGGIRSNAPALKTRVVVSPGRMRPTTDSTHVKKLQSSSTTLSKSKLSPPKGVVRTTSNLSAPIYESQQDIHESIPIPLSKRTSSFPSNAPISTTTLMEPSSSSNGIGGNGPIFIHGVPEDTSFATQIANLREANRIAYEEAILNLDPSTHDSSFDDEMRIRVAVRKRPMIPRKDTGAAASANNIKVEEVDVIHPLQYLDYGKLLVYQPKTRVDLTKEVETISFAFDNVYDENSTNTQIYNETIRALIPGLFEGRWASVFAYGQTGSGKTFTMMGSTMTGMKAAAAGIQKSQSNNEENLGLYYLAARDLFQILSRNQHNNLSIGVSLFEIYSGKLFDLLNDRAPVKCLEDQKGRVCFPGLSEHPVSQPEHLMRIIEDGNYRRSTGSTSANADSSRSHAVLQLCLRKQVDRKSSVEHGRLTFIDLAGSERGADTNKASKTTRLEGAEINTSLLALKEVIRALAIDGNMNHIPFRGSKLTQVLKESFVGKNSRTVMVACVAPNLMNCEHTLNTLRYTDRVKERNAETGLVAVVAAGSTNAPRVQKKPVPPMPMSFDDRPFSAPTFGSSSIPRNSNKRLPIEDVAKSALDHDDIEVILEDVNADEPSQAESIDLNEVLESPAFFHERTRRSSHFSSTAELDEILQSPRHKGGQVIASASSDSMVDLLDDEAHAAIHIKAANSNGIGSRKDGASSLVYTHRNVMTQMLSMVKQEMLLVNCADTDRELVDEYIIEIERMHEKQLSMISELRQSLVSYYAERPSLVIHPS